MTDKFDEYLAILGSEKMQKMWQIFLFEAEKGLELTAEADKDELRLKFHNLRPAAVIFGMEQFSACCNAIEQAVINGAETAELAKEIEEAKIIFKQQRQAVGAYLE